jgi:DNA-binding transcriptional LysR family regulator
MPDIALDLSVIDSLPQIEALRKGHIDAGFVHRSAQTEADMDYRQMAEEDLLLALPQSHRLSRRKSVKLGELRGEPLIFLARNIAAPFYDLFVESCMAGGLAPKIVQEARSATMVLNLVSVGVGLGFVSSGMRGRHVEGVLLKKVTDLKIPLYFDLIWRKANPYPALTRFVEHALAVARSPSCRVNQTTRVG